MFIFGSFRRRVDVLKLVRRSLLKVKDKVVVVIYIVLYKQIDDCKLEIQELRIHRLLDKANNLKFS